MSRKLKGWLLGAVSMLVVAVLGGVGYVLADAHYAKAPCVTVNGVVLTNHEVDVAYDQQKNGLAQYTRQQVVDATVRNMVVRDYGREQGVTVTETELDDILIHYKETGYYESAVDLYGEKGLRQGLANHELFIRSKQLIFDKEITVTGVTQEDILAFLADNGLESMVLTDKQREDVVSTLSEHKAQEAYDAFVDTLLKRADIVYG